MSDHADVMDGPPDRLLTAAEVAERLAVSERWIRDATRTGVIPHIVLGHYRRYSWPKVAEWLEEQQQGGSTLSRRR